MHLMTGALTGPSNSPYTRLLGTVKEPSPGPGAPTTHSQHTQPGHFVNPGLVWSPYRAAPEHWCYHSHFRVNRITDDLKVLYKFTRMLGTLGRVGGECL